MEPSSVVRIVVEAGGERHEFTSTIDKHDVKVERDNLLHVVLQDNRGSVKLNAFFRHWDSVVTTAVTE